MHRKTRVSLYAIFAVTGDTGVCRNEKTPDITQLVSWQVAVSLVWTDIFFSEIDTISVLECYSTKTFKTNQFTRRI